jgi:hypothetical protein
MPPQGDQAQGGPVLPPTVLPQGVVVEPDGDNTITLTLPPAAGKR